MGQNVNLTTLCYLEQNQSYLMLYRNRKRNDPNEGKWIGVGGHFEHGESPEECLIREVQEETGLTLLNWRFRGIVTFTSDCFETEYMCLYTSDSFRGELAPCREGDLKWIPKSQLAQLNLWAGDRIFLELLEGGRGFFSLKLRYEGDLLVEASLDNQKMQLN